jgi:transcriptional regulator with XRE-family HTH domain
MRRSRRYRESSPQAGAGGGGAHAGRADPGRAEPAAPLQPSPRRAFPPERTATYDPARQRVQSHEFARGETMAGTSDLIDVLKRELKAANMTYADLAAKLGMSASSVKRIFSQRETTLSRIDEICRALKLEFSDLAREVSDAQVLVQELTQEQEEALVNHKLTLLVGICCLSQWTFEQIVSTYRISEAECIRALTQLDRLGVLELKPLNRYRMKLAKTFRWRPEGPIMAYFRSHVLPDYYAGSFAAPQETLMLVHGSVGKAAAQGISEKLQRVAQEFAQQHLADQRLPERQRDGYTLVLALRTWEFVAFRDLRRA